MSAVLATVVYEPSCYGPMRIPPGGPWYYVGANDDFVWQVGSCAERCSGHANSPQAALHFIHWLLNHHTDYSGRYAGSPRPCFFCHDPSHGFVAVKWLGREIPLCPEHLGRDFVQEALGPMVDRFWR